MAAVSRYGLAFSGLSVQSICASVAAGHRMVCFASKQLLVFALFVSSQYAISEPLYRRPSYKLMNDDLHYVETDYDWDGDGIPDHFRLRVQKEVEPLLEGLEQTPSKTQHWSYHCWLVVESGFDNSTLWEDEWSVRESDIASFREVLDFKTPDEFFSKWFRWKFGGGRNQELNLNFFDVRQLEDREVSEDVLASEMKRLKIEGITAAELKRMVLENKSSRIFVYRGSRRENIRWATYVPRLRKIMIFQYGFAD